MSEFTDVASWLAAMPKELNMEAAQAAKAQLEQLLVKLKQTNQPSISQSKVDIDDACEAMSLLTAGADEPPVDELRRVYLGCLSHLVQEHDIRVLFEFDNLKIESILMPKSRSDKPVNYAFVDLTCALDATKAVKLLNGKILKGKRVVVDIARPPSTTPSSPDEYQAQAFCGPSTNRPHKTGQLASTYAPTGMDCHFYDAKMKIISRAKTYEDYSHDIKLDDVQKAELLNLDKRVTKLRLQRDLGSEKPETEFAETSNENHDDNFEAGSSATSIATRRPIVHSLHPPLNNDTGKDLNLSSSSRIQSISQRVNSTSPDNQSSAKTSISMAPRGTREETLLKEIENMKTQIHHLNQDREVNDPMRKQKAVVYTKEGIKTHCTFFLRTGYCDFMQQGCKYSHELPPGGIEELRRQAGLPPLGLGTNALKFANNNISELPLGRGGQKHGMRHAKLDFSQPTPDIPTYRQTHPRPPHRTTTYDFGPPPRKYASPYNKRESPPRRPFMHRGQNRSETKISQSVTPSASVSQAGDPPDTNIMDDVINRLQTSVVESAQSSDLMSFTTIKH